MTRYRLILGSAIGAALCATRFSRRTMRPKTCCRPNPRGDRAAARLYEGRPARPPPQPSVEDSFDDIRMSSGEVVQQLPVLVREWNVAQAKQLLAFIPTVAAEGLVPSDYRAEALSAAIAQGPGTTLNETASEIFVWLVEDLRDGRTPMDARRQWFVVDPDADVLPSHACSKRRSQAATSRRRLLGSTRSRPITRDSRKSWRARPTRRSAS